MTKTKVPYARAGTLPLEDVWDWFLGSLPGVATPATGVVVFADGGRGTSGFQGVLRFGVEGSILRFGVEGLKGPSGCFTVWS